MVFYLACFTIYYYALLRFTGDVALPCPGTQQGPITSTVAASSPRRAQNAFVNVNINTNSTSTSTSHAQESPTGGGHARSTISTTSNTTNSTTENTTGNTTGAAKEEGGVSNGAKASLLPRRGKGTTTAPQERLEGDPIRRCLLIATLLENTKMRKYTQAVLSDLMSQVFNTEYIV